MHREFAPDRPLAPPPLPAGLAALALLLAALLAADLVPLALGSSLPRELFGVRFALMAAVIGGAHTLYNALARAGSGRIGADLAVAIACVAAILIDEPVVAAEVVVIGLAGELLEAWTAGRAQRSVGALAELFPERCWVVRDGAEVRTFTRDVLVGDTVVIKPGGKVPADGVVRAGTAAVTVAALTGESLPVDKSPGDSVLAGSTVPTGSLTIEVTRTGTDTTAGRVIAFTENALRTKGDAERQADRLARYFLPVVLALAALTFLGHFVWQRSGGTPDAPARSAGAEGAGQDTPVTAGSAARLAAYPALAVLVVACPCPLVLATPAAVVAALGRLAGTGVLVKGGAALERLAAVTAVAVDKTGTLTTGRLQLGSLRPAPGVTPADLLATAAAAETGSEHPAAAPIVEGARARGLTLPAVTAFAARPGLGVSATVADATVLVGSARFLDLEGVTVPDATVSDVAELATLGEGAVVVARAGVVLGVLGVTDTLRPEAAGVVSELAALGLPVTLLTGDRTAAAVAGLPFAALHTGLLPTEKADLLPANALFVGDGLNDAPALARAHVGAAVGGGPATAADAADVVLLGEPLAPLPLLVKLGRETVRVIRQNIIGFGFALNLFGVVLTGWLWPAFAPTAAWAERAPVAAAVFHQVGALLVLANSMRLLAFDRPPSRLGRATRRLNAALERGSLDDLLHGLAHRWKPVTAGIFCVSLVAWLLSGLTAVRPDEVALVQRFGALRGDLAPGLHARWPWPVEAVTRTRPGEPRLVTIGFRRATADRAAAVARARADQRELRGDELTWSADHLGDAESVADESTYVTGDGNLLELLATVRVRVTDPRSALLTISDPDDLVRAAAEAALRERVAAGRLADLLTADRSRLETACAARVRDRLPAAIGVTVDGVTVHDLHPPAEVVASYHAVAEAIQKRDRTINVALADGTRTRQRAEAAAQATVRAAEADARAKVATAEAQHDSFADWVRALNTLPPDAESRMAAGPMLAERRGTLLRERRELIEFRLGLAAVTAALRGRDKVLVDAADLPGRRHLLLADPSALPLAAPPGGR